MTSPCMRKRKKDGSPIPLERRKKTFVAMKHSKLNRSPGGERGGQYKSIYGQRKERRLFNALGRVFRGPERSTIRQAGEKRGKRAVSLVWKRNSLSVSRSVKFADVLRRKRFLGGLFLTHQRKRKKPPARCLLRRKGKSPYCQSRRSFSGGGKGGREKNRA